MTDPLTPDLAAFNPVRMGLAPLDEADWLKARPGDGALLAERARLIAAHPGDVIAFQPEAAAAVAELAKLLETKGFGALGRASGAETLGAIGCAEAEDLCILTAADGGYRLTAGVMCFPNRWRVAEKLGKPLLGVHEPVPDYAESLAAAVDRFLAKLRPMRAFIRDNWGLASQPTLHLPDPIAPTDPETGGEIYVRREAQSFLKLPGTEAVIFAIRTTILPWGEAPEAERAGILATVKTLSPAWLTYKSIHRS